LNSIKRPCLTVVLRVWRMFGPAVMDDTQLGATIIMRVYREYHNPPRSQPSNFSHKKNI